MKFSCWLEPKQLQHILIPDSWAVKNRRGSIRRQGPNCEFNSWCQLMPSQVCARSSTCICQINHSVGHLQQWVGVNQGRLGTSMLPWAAHVDGKDFSAAERQILIYLLATSSSLWPPFPVSCCRLTKGQKVTSDSFMGTYCSQKRVSVTVFCSSRTNDVLLSLNNKTKHCQQPGISEQPSNDEWENEAQLLQAVLCIKDQNSKMWRLPG